MEDIAKNEAAAAAEAVATPATQKFVIGVSISHIYSVPIDAVSTDDAILKLDDWLRGTTPPATFTPEIISSELNVIGVGILDEVGAIREAGSLSKEARAELDVRGRLPDTGSTHLFPDPPRAAVTSTGELVDLITAGVSNPVQ